MPTDPIIAATDTPTEVPKRPTMYALACIRNGKWNISYAGCSRDWIVNSQQSLHPGSVLVIVPGEEEPPHAH